MLKAQPQLRKRIFCWGDVILTGSCDFDRGPQRRPDLRASLGNPFEGWNPLSIGGVISGLLAPCVYPKAIPAEWNS